MHNILTDCKLHRWEEVDFRDSHRAIIIAVMVGLTGRVILSVWFPFAAALFFLVVVFGFILGKFAWVVWHNFMMRRALFRMHEGVDPLVFTCKGEDDIKRIIDNGIEGEFHQFVYVTLSTRVYRTAIARDIPIIPRLGGWHRDTTYFRFADDHNRVMFKLLTGAV